MEPESNDYIGRYWKKLDVNKIVCHLCPRHCVLMEGQRGFCFVRENRHGQMVLTTYGFTAGFCVDPVEKKPLYHFYPGTGILSFGTAGCNLGCQFCQNWDLSRSRDSGRTGEKAAPLTIAKTAKKMGCQSVAFTYNDPVIFAEYAIDTAKACHDLGLKTVAVTAGYISQEARPDFFEPMDAVNVDLKSFSDKFYQEISAGHLQPVLDTLVHLKHKTHVWLEITNLLIPGKNDSDEEIRSLCQWIAGELGPGVPLHFSAFHPSYKMRNYPSTPLTTLKRAKDIAVKSGLRYIYLGNVVDTQSGNTFCHACGRLLIERDWYEIVQYHLKNNQCEFCGTVCAGHFGQGPGSWGSRRVPVRLS